MSFGPLIGAALAGGALVLGPVLREDARRGVGERRDTMPGRIASLSRGRTHYRLEGPPGAPVAVLVHGARTPGYVWDGVAAGLLGMGYQVLVYDLYGRGWSDRPPGAQDATFFTGQLSELLDRLDIDAPVTLFGYSMGAAIAAAFAARHPARVERLVLVAPAGMGGFPSGFLRFTRDAGWTGRWLFHLLYPACHRRAARRARAAGVAAPTARACAHELRWRGFTPAVLATLRGILRDPLELEHRRIAATGLPVLAVWAGADRTIPLEGMGTLTQWNRGAVHDQVADADHWLPLSQPEAVLAAFRDWLPHGPTAAPAP